MEKSENLLVRLKRQAGNLQKEIHALYLAYRDPRTPWIARVVALLVVGYAVSPIDLVPDFIPVLGYLDDLIIVPAGVALALKLIPPQVMADARGKADQARQPGKMNGWVGLVMIVVIWLGVLALVILLALRFYRRMTG
jgi:uncharacterized membrane protein YkvA (DUF1232 family)